jgi:hypothetical protein
MKRFGPKGLLTLVRVWLFGFADGFSSPRCLSSGMSYPSSRLNEAYDRGANMGQLIGAWAKWTDCEGEMED